MEAILQILIFGLSYRIRGGLGNEFVRKLLKKPEGWEIPNFIIRAQWALLVTVSLLHNTDLWLLFPLVLAAAYWGCTEGYWKGQFDLLRPENRNTKNYRILTLRGMFTFLPVALVLLPFSIAHPWYGVAAGVLFVPCYLAGLLIHRYLKQQSYSQWGEWLLGISYGGALWISHQIL